MRRTLILVACLAAACSSRPSFDAGVLTIAGRTRVHVAVADTEATRQRGLMGVRSVPDGDGMAFLFDRPTTRGFWMKETTVPLSAAFWDGTERIVAILEMSPCHRDPCRVYEPGHAYVGALEVGSGFLADHEVRVGDRVTLLRSDH